MYSINKKEKDKKEKVLAKKFPVLLCQGADSRRVMMTKSEYNYQTKKLGRTIFLLEE